MAIPIPPPPPPPRKVLRPLSHAQRVKRYGSFKWTATPTPQAPERIQVDPAWLTRNIVVIELPHLAHCNGGSPVRARVHRLVADPMLHLFDTWRSMGLSLHLQSWDGCLAVRYKRGKAGGTEADLSNHAWGSAMDLNARWNRLGQPPAGIGRPGCLLPLVAIANDQGWAWGGDFTTPDGMHWEYVG